MNRQQRRKVEKVARSRGASGDEAKSIAMIVSNADEIRKGGTGAHTTAKSFNDGDKVKLNIEAVKSRKNYDRMLPLYKEFVETSEDTVFTVHVEQGNLISFIEEPKWLFWSGDLIKVE